MPDIKFYSPEEFQTDIPKLARLIMESWSKDFPPDSIYGVPRGGWIIAVALAAELEMQFELDIHICATLPNKNANVIVVDDVIDSGDTIEHYQDYFTAVLHVKKHAGFNSNLRLYSIDNIWMQYFWERPQGMGVADNIQRLLQYIGEDPAREGLIETPKRVVRSYDKLFSGYKIDPASVIKTFTETDGYDEMVLLKDIELFSMCEHHMLPFIGKAHIAYIPNRKVIGISKLARLLEVYSRRLQIQERLTNQITTALMQYLQPQGAACVIEAKHLCMTMRGVEKQNSVMTTSSLKGVFIEKLAARNEFMRLIGK